MTGGPFSKRTNMPEASTPVLIVREDWLQKIMRHEKTVEIRGRATHMRGRIGLGATGAQTVVAIVEITDCVGPLDAAQFEELADRHCIPLAAAAAVSEPVHTDSSDEIAASMHPAEKVRVVWARYRGDLSQADSVTRRSFLC